MARYDLHTHSCHSDGVLTPADLVSLAHDRGVDVLALTDHDTTDGVAAARSAARGSGMEIVAGVEISVTWMGRTVHVVGLRVDPGNDALARGLAGLREIRHARAREMGRRLARHRIAGAYEEARRRAHGAVVSRTHFARFLAEAGYAPSAGGAFKRFLAPGRPGHVPVQWATLADAVAWIRGAGGEAVVAHPGRYPLSAGALTRLIGEFRDCGGAGIEVLSGSQRPEASGRFAAVAARHGLLASLGSDYHGPGNSWTDLGALPDLPAEAVPIWRDWRAVAAATA